MTAADWAARVAHAHAEAAAHRTGVWATPSATERQEEAACDGYAASQGCDVVSLSAIHRVVGTTRGVPDRRYRWRPVGRDDRAPWALWYEVKRVPLPGRAAHAAHKLTRAQFVFLARELAAGQLATCGDRAVLVCVLGLLRTLGAHDARVRAACADHVDACAAHGLRDAPAPGYSVLDPRATVL